MKTCFSYSVDYWTVPYEFYPDYPGVRMPGWSPYKMFTDSFMSLGELSGVS